MHFVRLTFLAEFFKLQLFFDLLLVSGREMIDALAILTSHLYQVFSRHFIVYSI